MEDPIFAALLHDIVSVRRPVVELSPAGSPQTPVYEFVVDEAPCALQPATSTAASTVIGSVERATHVAYLQLSGVCVGDLLVERIGADALSVACSAGDQTVTVSDGSAFAAGDRLEIGIGGSSELALASSVVGDEIMLFAPLRVGHEEGESVSRVVAYEVLGSCDEAGAGHHVRVGLRMLTS